MITTAPRSALPCGGASRAAILRPMNVPPYRSVTLALARPQRHLGRTVRQHRGEPGQRRRKREHLGADPRLAQHRRPHQMQIDRGVGLHRAAHVADQDDPPGPAPRPRSRQRHRFPAGRARCVHRRPQVDPLAVCGSARTAGCAAAASARRTPPATNRAGEGRRGRSGRTARRPARRCGWAAHRAAGRSGPRAPSRSGGRPGDPRQLCGARIRSAAAGCTMPAAGAAGVLGPAIGSATRGSRVAGLDTPERPRATPRRRHRGLPSG